MSDLVLSDQVSEPDFDVMEGSAPPVSMPPTNPNVVVPDQTTAVLAMMAEMLREMRASRAAPAQSEAIETLAKAVQMLVNAENARPKENPNSPGVSVLNPLGERDHPRADFRCKRVFWAGHRLNKFGLTANEIELINRIQPGHYRVTKADGSTIPFDVLAKHDLAGRLEQLMFQFPCKTSEDRQNHLSMVSYLKEAMGESMPSVELLMDLSLIHI